MLATVGDASAPARQPFVLLVGAGLLLAGLVVLWRFRRSTPPLVSKRWFAVATAVFFLWAGLIFCLLFIDPSARAFNTFATWSLVLPALPVVIGLICLAVEAREDRLVRTGLGMSPLRRRLAWGWVALGWWAVTSVFVLLGFAAFAYLSPNAADPTNPTFLVVYLIVSYGGGVLAGFVQAWRRRARDRQILQESLDLAKPAHIEPPVLAPAWMPRTVGVVWLEARRSLNGPVKPGEEVGVIAVAATVATGFVFMAGLVVYGAATSSPPSGGPLAVVVILGVVAFIALHLIAPLGAGLGTAIRQLRADQRTPPSPAGDEQAPPAC